MKELLHLSEPSSLSHSIAGPSSSSDPIATPARTIPKKQEIMPKKPEAKPVKNREPETSKKRPVSPAAEANTQKWGSAREWSLNNVAIDFNKISRFILEIDNFRKSAKYALDFSNFKNVEGLQIIQATQHQDNVRVKNARGDRVDVRKSYGAACLSCCLSYLAAKDPNLFDSAYFDVVLGRGKRFI